LKESLPLRPLLSYDSAFLDDASLIGGPAVMIGPVFGKNGMVCFPMFNGE
jgi:hypothetical protein